MPGATFLQKKQNCMITVKLESRVLIGHFFPYEVNHISLASVFGSLPRTENFLLFRMVYYLYLSHIRK